MVINLRLVARLLAPAVLGMGLVGIIPAFYAGMLGSPGFAAFLFMSCCALIISHILRLIGRKAAVTVTIRELFLFTVSLWIISAAISALPVTMLLPDINYAAALFETASALSATGATAINHLDVRPEAVLLWRSMLQFIGSIGFVIIGVAVLPSFMLGGLSLFKTETSCFDGNIKVTPHVKTMALYIIFWYLGITVLCTLCYLLCGLDMFLALNAAFCTVATGGMMPVDASMNDLPAMAHYTAIVFMFLGSCPFMVILLAFTGQQRNIFKDEQVRGFLRFILLVSALVAGSLYVCNDYDPEKAWRVALFNVVSILSTTGFALEDFTQWNSLATIIFFFILPIGGCSGSTSGGIKFFRLQICRNMLVTQLTRTIHPHIVLEPQFNGQRLSREFIRLCVTFFTAYVLLVIISGILSVMLGLGITDAITATITCLSNVGPAMGNQLGPSSNFADLSGALHVLFAFDMLAGRLEIIPVILCMTRMFWRW